MSEDKQIKEIDTILEDDMIPNPPRVNGKLIYYIIAFTIVFAVLSVLAVVFSSERDKNDNETASIVETRYII